MTFDPKKFAVANQASVESLLSVANAALSAAERIVALNMDTTRNAIGDSFDAAKSIIGATDAQTAFAAQQAMVQPAIEKATAYSKSLYDISNDVQQQVSKLFETQVAEFQKASTEAMSQLTKNAPAGSEAIVKAMQDAFAKATTAFGTASAMTKQFTDATQVAVKAATSKAKSK